MRLSLLICTFNEGISNIFDLLLPPSEQVEYVISFQYTDSTYLALIPHTLAERSDVKIVSYKGKGLSANRNHALQHCTTELALICDDDVRYTPDKLSMLIKLFEQHPEVDIALFQVAHPNGAFIKAYAAHSYEYSQRPRGSYVSSCEIALRTSAPYPLFDLRFGLGAPFLACGEEEVWLHQAWLQGSRIRYFPQLLCTIPDEPTTGLCFTSDVRVRRSKGAVLYMIHGFWSSLLRITATALRFPCSVPRWAYWCDMLAGICYIAFFSHRESQPTPRERILRRT